MPDLSAVAAALSSFNTLKSIAQAMIDLRDAQAFKAKIIDFQNALIDAQGKVFSVNDERAALIERVGELEKKVADLEAWETEKQRYELKTIAAGSFAYVLKPSAQGSEPPHQICANCYQSGKKSILQKEPGSIAHQTLGRPEMYCCPECKTKIIA